MIFMRVLDWCRAKYRGDVRVASIGCRGRVFARRSKNDSITGFAAGRTTIKTRVWRAATKTWEKV